MIGPGRAFIIAEVGSNHAASLATALASIAAAAEAGADAVKFQSLNLDALYHQPSDAVRALHAKIDLPEEWHAPLKECCEKHDLDFLSSATYFGSIDAMESIDVALYKLASAQVAVFPQLVQRLAKLGKPVILSTGLVTQNSLDRVVNLFREAGNHRFIILHCNSMYPAPAEIVHLPRMNDHAQRYGCLVGFSDHTVTNNASVAAVAMGASVIERHFTLSRQLDSPDAHLSLEPANFKAFVEAVREAELICRPSPRTALEPDEAAFAAGIHHSLLTTRAIQAGDKLDDCNTTWMRGCSGPRIDAWDLLNKPAPIATVDIASSAWVTPAQIQIFDSRS